MRTLKYPFSKSNIRVGSNCLESEMKKRRRRKIAISRWRGTGAGNIADEVSGRQMSAIFHRNN